jgi:hypothetical protein
MAFSFPPTNSKQLSTTISDTHKKYKKKRKKKSWAFLMVSET